MFRYIDHPQGRDRNGPFFVVSDIHKGAGGARDNFAVGHREQQFLNFLDHVDRENGRLVIAGDLLELWQNNISKVLTESEWLFDRFEAMRAVYVLGNHDADLYYFIGQNDTWLPHSFFESMCMAANLFVAGKNFRISHGHEADPYCASSTPGIGRITAIYAGLKEDRNGSPMAGKYRTVESKTIGRMDRLVDVWHRICGKPDRFRKMNQDLIQDAGKNIIITGHTHRPGMVEGKLYNCGTWAEAVNSFVRIDLDGTVGVFDWADGKATRNLTELPI
jgi:UDP-2,3-diacylglucosamine pyrophosphatase LpxH